MNDSEKEKDDSDKKVSCPNCKGEAHRDVVLLGTLTVLGPWKCKCGWHSDRIYRRDYSGW